MQSFSFLVLVSIRPKPLHVSSLTCSCELCSSSGMPCSCPCEWNCGRPGPNQSFRNVIGSKFYQSFKKPCADLVMSILYLLLTVLAMILPLLVLSRILLTSVAGAGFFGWSWSRFFHPAPAPAPGPGSGFKIYTIYLQKKMPTA